MLRFKSYILMSLLLTGCFRIQEDTSLTSSSLGGPAVEKIECQFLSVTTLGSVLRDVLGLTNGDTAIMTSQTQASGQRYIATYSGALGAGGRSVPSQTTCTSLKYKLAAEIMINACQEAPADRMQNLFPNGPTDLSTLFVTFLGRTPTQEESDAIRKLQSEVSSGVMDRAACAAVSSSLEALARNI